MPPLSVSSRSLFLEKRLVIEPTYTATDTNLGLKINLFQEIQLARNDTLFVFETREVLVTAANHFSLYKRNIEMIVTVSLKFTILDNFNDGKKNGSFWV